MTLQPGRPDLVLVAVKLSSYPPVDAVTGFGKATAGRRNLSGISTFAGLRKAAETCNFRDNALKAAIGGFACHMSITIITDGVLSAFADLIQANSRRLYRVWLIAPWIGSADSGSDPVFRIVQALNGTPCRLIVVTRPPVAVWHLRAIQSLRRHSNHEVFGSAALHSKLYIVECNGFRAAIFGSPNLTPAADEQNQELAVEFRSSRSGRDDPTSAVISELLSYASTLRTHDDVVPLE